jgi:hypothetical protein
LFVFVCCLNLNLQYVPCKFRPTPGMFLKPAEARMCAYIFRGENVNPYVNYNVYKICCFTVVLYVQL